MNNNVTPTKEQAFFFVFSVEEIDDILDPAPPLFAHKSTFDPTLNCLTYLVSRVTEHSFSKCYTLKGFVVVF